MFRSKTSLLLLLTSILLYTSVINAEIILKPLGPSTFGTVTGTVGLTSETITEGTITASLTGMTTSSEVDANGGFTLSVGADTAYSLNANLTLTGVPGITMNFENLPPIAAGETRQLNLTRASGRLLGRVNVIGGSLQDLSLTARSSDTNGAIIESFGSSGSAEAIDNQVPEVLLAMPSGMTTEIFGEAQITSEQGCQIEEALASQSVILPDSSTTNPVLVEWTIDVSSVTCNPASLNGTFRIDGLDSSAILTNHQLGLDGPVYRKLNLTEFAPYQFDQLVEGNYLVQQQSRFSAPFGELSYPDANIEIAGNANYDAIHAVGTARGQVTLAGQWDYTNVNTASVRLSGSSTTTPTDIMFANDDIDLFTGNYDLVLGAGNWNLQNYLFEFEEEMNEVKNSQSVNVSLLPEEGVTRFAITEGQSLNLPVAAYETFTANLDLVVEQQSDLPEVTIERLLIFGQAQLFEPLDNKLLGATTLIVTRFGPQANRFLIMVYGLPGTYQLTATGRGSDGRTYLTTFELILGQDTPDTPDPLGCFGINKMMVHLADGKRHDNDDDDDGRHRDDDSRDGDDDDDDGRDRDDDRRYGDDDDDDGRDRDDHSRDGDDDDEDEGKSHAKIHIQKAGFRLPEGVMVDLSQDNVSIAVDGITYEIPPGSFKQRGNKQHFGYKSANGTIPHIQARLDFDKAEWTFRVKESDISQIDNSDGVDVTLTIGNYVGTENIIMHSKDRHGTKLKYKRKPKLSCRVGNKEKKKDDDEDQDD